MKFFLFCFLALGLSATFCRAGGDRPTVSVRFYVQAINDIDKDHVFAVTLTNPPQMIYINKKPELTERDVNAVEILDDKRVLLHFDGEGSRKLESLTQAYRGLKLVVVVDGRVVYAPVIDVILTQGKFLIPDGMTTQEAINLKVMAEIKRRSLKK
jgi:preprotein translocase subunit SecD